MTTKHPCQVRHRRRNIRASVRVAAMLPPPSHRLCEEGERGRRRERKQREEAEVEVPTWPVVSRDGAASGEIEVETSRWRGIGKRWREQEKLLVPVFHSLFFC